MSKKSEENKDETKIFVDIHGREFSAVLIGVDKWAIALEDLKPTAFTIYHKEQFAKLSQTSLKLDSAFDNHMKQMAQTFMRQNNISFSQNEVNTAIDYCKRTLGGKQVLAENIFQHRSVTKNADDFTIQISNLPSSLSPTTSNKFHCSTPNAFSSKSPKPAHYHSLMNLTNRLGHLTLNEKNRADEFKKEFTTFTPTSPNDRQTNRPESKGKRQTGFMTKIVPPEEYDVVVKYIMRYNCVWVHKKDNGELLKKIQSKLNEEANFQKVAVKPYKMDKIYMAQHNDTWFRCSIWKFTPLIVQFVDYGTLTEVSELRNVSAELSEFPYVATRITFLKEEYTPHLDEEIRIKCFALNFDKSLFVNVLKVYPRVDVGRELNYFKRPPNLCSLENGQKVIITHQENGVFYLRTRECFQKLKEVELAISECIATAKACKTPAVDQLVLCYNRELVRFCRAVVTNVDKNVEVELLDYVGKVHASVELKLINERLAQIPCTYFSGGKLEEFEEITPDECFSAVVNEHIKKRTKFIVSLGFDDELNLLHGGQSLSDQIQKEQETGTKLRLKNVERFKPEFGLKSYLCGSYKNKDDLMLVPTEELQQYMDCVLMASIADNQPYTPVEGEICYCHFQEEWYRCVVTRALTKDFEVLLLDFGSTAVIKTNDFRKADDKICQAPALALPCKLTDVPNVPNVHDVLNKLIIEGEIYNVDVKCVSDGKFLIEMPSVYQQVVKSL